MIEILLVVIVGVYLLALFALLQDRWQITFRGGSGCPVC